MNGSQHRKNGNYSNKNHLDNCKNNEQQDHEQKPSSFELIVWNTSVILYISYSSIWVSCERLCKCEYVYVNSIRFFYICYSAQKYKHILITVVLKELWTLAVCINRRMHNKNCMHIFQHMAMNLIKWRKKFVFLFLLTHAIDSWAYFWTERYVSRVLITTSMLILSGCYLWARKKFLNQESFWNFHWIWISTKKNRANVTFKSNSLTIYARFRLPLAGIVVVAVLNQLLCFIATKCKMLWYREDRTGIHRLSNSHLGFDKHTHTLNICVRVRIYLVLACSLTLLLGFLLTHFNQSLAGRLTGLEYLFLSFSLSACPARVHL